MLKITLRAARVNAGLQQKEAAAALKVSNKTLSHWEAGVSTPKQKHIDAICDLYGVSYDNLVFLPNHSL